MCVAVLFINLFFKLTAVDFQCCYTTVLHLQGNSPRQQALKAEDKELAAYLESKQPKGKKVHTNPVYMSLKSSAQALTKT